MVYISREREEIKGCTSTVLNVQIRNVRACASATAHEPAGSAGEDVFCPRVAPCEGVCLGGGEFEMHLQVMKKINEI